MLTAWPWQRFAFAMMLGSGGCVDRLIVDETGTIGSSASGGATGDPDSASGDTGDDDDDDETPPVVVDIGGPDDDPACAQGEADCDGDGIPADDDPFPNDPDMPGTVRDDVIYANTQDALFVIDPREWTAQWVASFSFDTMAGGVTDIAIDSHGVLYAVTPEALFVCSPDDGRCFFLALLGGVNGAGFAPGGNDDVLYVAQFDGAWVRVELHGADAFAEIVDFLPNAASSGDITSIDGLTLVSVDAVGGSSAQVVIPETGELLGVYGFVDLQVWGLASFGGTVVGFSPDGLIWDASGVLLAQSPESWWGAAVHPGSG